MQEVVYLPTLVRGLPPPPLASLDPYLDAATACFVRHGITRSSIGDFAKELGVSRTTVYRQVGSVDNVLRLIMARELHRLQQTVPAAIEGAAGPESVVRVFATVVRLGLSNPVLTKLLRDEHTLLGQLLADQITGLFDQVATILTPVLEVAMAAGLIRGQDPKVLAHWISRMGAALILAPPPIDLDILLDEMLLPVLRPAPSS